MLVFFAWTGSCPSSRPTLAADHGRVGRIMECTVMLWRCVKAGVCKAGECGRLYNLSCIGIDKEGESETLRARAVVLWNILVVGVRGQQALYLGFEELHCME